jgi:hypothetical protein
MDAMGAKMRAFSIRALRVASSMAFAFYQTGPAMAYGPYEEFGGRTGIKPMVYFHLSLGPSSVESNRTGSFGFALKNEFSYAHPAYQRERGPYSDTAASFGLMDLSIGLDGKFRGLALGGMTTLGDKAPKN